MVVEIMGLLIFIGVALLFFSRYQGGSKGKKEIDSKELATSIELLHKEMDKASSAAIERMGSHVNRFERLIKDAKTSGDNLSYNIKEIRGLEDRLRKELAETRAAFEELKRERERTIDLRDELTRQASLASQIINSAPVDTHNVINVTSIRAVNSYEESSVAPEQSYNTPLLNEPDNSLGKSSNNFADILSESMERAEQEELESLEPLKETYEPSDEAAKLLEEEKQNPSNVAKKLLASGASVEEVTRQTGMGRGAVELLAQMIRR